MLCSVTLDFSFPHDVVFIGRTGTAHFEMETIETERHNWKHNLGKCFTCEMIWVNYKISLCDGLLISFNLRNVHGSKKKAIHP